MVVGVVRGYVLGDRLVFLHARLDLPLRLEVRLPRSLGTDAEGRQDFLEVGGLARRARRRIAFSNERLELMLTGAALVFVEWHRFASLGVAGPSYFLTSHSP